MIDAESIKNESIEKRKQQISSLIKRRYNYVLYILLLIIIWINIKIRTFPMKIRPETGNPGLWDITTNSWTLGPDLDPFLFLRWAKEIIATGTLSIHDSMRYVPVGFNTSSELKLLSYLIAWTHNIISFFSPNSTVNYGGVIFPVIMSVFSTIAIFLLVRKVFENFGKKESNISGLIASALFITFPALLPRMIAGIPEKEAPGTFFMILSFYLIIEAWKSKNNLNALIFGILAGISTALMGLVWGGVIYLFATIGGAFFIAYLLGKIDVKETIVVTSWILSTILILVSTSDRYTLKGMLSSEYMAIGILIAITSIIYIFVKNNKIKDKFQKLYKNKIPLHLSIFIFTIVLGIIVASIIFGPSFVPDKIDSLKSQVTVPTTDRLGVTVAENRQPYFSEWKPFLSPSIIKNKVPLFFWLFFIGVIVLFYETIKNFKLKEKVLLTSTYTFMLLGVIFSRSSPDKIMNGVSSQSKFFLFGSMVLFGLSLLYVAYQKYKKKEVFQLKEIDFGYLLIHVFLLVTLFAAKGGVRLIMFLGIPGAILIAYLIVKQTMVARENKDEHKKVIMWGLFIIIILGGAYTLYSNYEVSKATAYNHVPSSYTQQWQKAMSWVRENTSENAVFGHWWDYGYWVQSIGERATMLDGGNAIFYWNYLMGRHVLTGETEEEALEVLYTHNVTHFLIDSTEIGKYSAYSSIGSDDNYDRFSFIQPLIKNNQATQKSGNITLLVFSSNGIALDEDILFVDENRQDVFLSQSNSGLLQIVVPVENENQFMQPYGIYVSQGRQIKIPFRYLYYGGKLADFNSGLNATAFVMPSVDSQRFEPFGASMYLSPRNMRTLWVHLYLLGEGENFILVHNQPSPIVETLRFQGITAPDFVYYQGVQGPIKIWEVNYTGDEEFNQEYLQKKFS